MAWDHRYRQLQEGEVIQQGDEVLCDKEWEPAGCTVGGLAPSPLYTSHRRYRRLKDAEVTGHQAEYDGRPWTDILDTSRPAPLSVDVPILTVEVPARLGFTQHMMEESVVDRIARLEVEGHR
jgi:hypothetical protein